MAAAYEKIKFNVWMCVCDSKMTYFNTDCFSIVGC